MAWGVATFNTALCLREQGRPREAIALLEELLESKLDDRDPSGYLMDLHQNYHHRACLAISACYEALGDFRSAVRYAVLARDRYRYYTGCGNCMMQARHELAEKIARLEAAAGGQ